ncbi:MAG: hypothetical protein J5I93_09045 [Pirellulaceae bacterium]|nr:hypothetical protein [Pirellulaceae bacterium]
MPAQARNQVVRNGEIAVYHCWSRCVQRAFLCGQDSYTGDDYDYRRDWIEKLLEYQAGVFAVDVGNHSVLSNHMHLVARTRPDIAAGWSDEEVACRWKLAWPEWQPDQQRWLREPTDEDIERLLENPSKLAYARLGLSNLSWFMARCKEPIARLANTEMHRAGHFWEQRYGCREILDEQALLTCMVYVDLNQIKAGMAATLEDSRTSAIAARLAAWRAREAQASLEEFHSSRGGGGYDLSLEQVEALLKDAWLAPICSGGLLITQSDTELSGSSWRLEVAEVTDESTPALLDSPQVASERVETCAPVAAGAETSDGPPVSLSSCSATGTNEAADSSQCDATSAATPASDAGLSRAETTMSKAPSHARYRRLFPDGRRRRRASDNPILDMPMSEYVRILLWVVAQTVAAHTAPESDPLALVQHLRSYGLDPDRWTAAVDNFDEWFGRAVGSVERLRELLDRSGDRWVKGMRNCRATFG